MMAFFNLLWVIAGLFGWASTGNKSKGSGSGHWGRKW